MADIKFSSAEVSALEAEIRKDAAAVPKDVKDVSCKLWPAAQQAIEALLKIITNPIAKLVLNLVLAIGNAAQAAICK